MRMQLHPITGRPLHDVALTVVNVVTLIVAWRTVRVSHESVRQDAYDAGYDDGLVDGAPAALPLNSPASQFAQ